MEDHPCFGYLGHPVSGTRSIFTPVDEVVAVTNNDSVDDSMGTNDDTHNAADKDAATRVEGDKEAAAAKRQKVTLREIPRSCSLTLAAKDGNRLFHSVGSVR